MSTGPVLREGPVVATIALASMLAPLNSTMLAVALPRLVTVFAAPVGTVTWLVTMYLIAMATLQPVAGKLGDRFGRRRLILAGLAAFALASAGAAVSGDLVALFVFRALQAVAGAIALPNGAALLRQVIPAARRGTRFGLLGSATSFAAAAGPPLGGVLVGLLDWRSIFLVNVVIVVPALVLGWRSLPADHGVQTRAEPNVAPFDVWGALGLSVVLAALAELLTRVDRPDSAPLLLVGGPVVVLALVLLLWHELHHADPVLQPRFFARRSFAGATGAVALSNLAMYSTLLAVPLVLSARGWTSARIGVLLAALSACTAVFAPLGGRLSDRYGRRLPTVAGLLLLSSGLGLIAVGGAAGLRLPLGLALSGLGLGLSGAGMQTAALEAVPGRQAGAAAGAYSTSRYLGSIIGSSVLAALVAPAATGARSPIFILVAISALCSAGAATAILPAPAAATDAAEPAHA